MKHGRIAIMYLMACAATLVQAQTRDVKVLAEYGGGSVTKLSRVYTDSISGLKVAEWPGTENMWIKDSCWVEKVPIVADSKGIFGTHFETHVLPVGYADYSVTSWRLTEEGDETVLHCYMAMPADILSGIWLASEETAILDKETGIQYRAKRSVPDCWKKSFGVQAPQGSVLDFQIFFPRLPETTRKIAIYGVPNWHMRGKSITLNRAVAKSSSDYDAVPKFHVPKQLHAEKNYNKNDGNSWSEYTDPHLIKPVDEYTLALWRTPDATYLAMAKEQNWMREYYGVHPGTMLVDEQGHQYKLKELQGLPLKNTFWMNGYSGDYFAFVFVFEPLPLDVETIHYVEPDGEPFEAWGAEWDGKTFYGLSVEELRTNQRFFEYHKRVIVK